MRLELKKMGMKEEGDYGGIRIGVAEGRDGVVSFNGDEGGYGVLSGD